MMGLRYNDPGLLKIFGGEERMIESPVLQKVVHEAKVKASHALVLGLLEARFKSVPADLAAAVTAVTDEDRLKRMNNLAGQCADLAAFRQQLQS
jgi:hypothetical protein